MYSNSSTLDSLDSFGPTVPGEFDFTLLFQDTILSIAPSVLLLLALPLRIWALRGKPRKVARSHLYENKLLFLVAFACMQAVILGLCATTTHLRTRASIAASVLTLVDAMGLCALSHAEHLYSIRPSAIINVYLLLTLPFDITRCRALWMLGSTKSVAAAFSSAIGIKVMVLITEAIEKRHILLGRYRYSSPEATSGIYSRSFFFWLNNLMRTGFTRVLSNEDLYPIDDDMTSRFLNDRAQETWKAANKDRKRALVWATLKTTRTPLLYCIFPRLCMIGFRYAQPFLLSRTVNFANNSDEPDSIGWGLTAAFGLVFLGLAISNGAYFHMCYRYITTAICQAFQYIHEIWAVPIELAISLYLLNRQLGLAFLAPAAVAIFSTIGILVMSKYMGNAQKIWMEGIQTRVDVTANMLSSMKSVKMLGFTSILTSIIQGLRVAELRLSTLFRKLLCVRVFFGRTLDAASAYTALSLISLLSTPMNVIVMTIPMLNAAMACFERIESFLKSDARRDHRLPLMESEEAKDDSSTISLNNEIPMKTFSSNIQPKDINSSLIVAQNASFAWSLAAQPARRHLCFIIGPVGSGKSTLLKGLLGETPSSQGFVYSNSPATAFVDQTSWIRNGTLQQNILGISTYDEKWYNQVVHSCGLESDIAILPKGHSTQVGSAGISLSGGQKQRLALARAVYAKKELIILDDVFSGLDAETEDHICINLLGKEGLFRQMGTTVLFATHAVQRLSYADHIIALSLTGQIVEQGPFEQLKSAGGYVQSLALKLKVEGSPSPRERNPENTAAGAKSATVLSAEAEEIEISAEDLNRQTGDFAVYKYYFSSIGWASSSMFFGWVVLYGVASKMTEFLLTYWTKAVAERGNEANGFYIGQAGLLGGIAELAMRMVPRSAEVLHARLLKTVMEAPLTFFTKTDTGQTTNRFSQDMTVLDAELPYSLVDLAFSLVVTMMGAALMCISAGYFAATVPPIILIVWVIQKYYLRTSRQIRLLDLEAKSPLYSHFIESLSGLVTIRAFGWGENFQKPYYLLFCIQRWLALVLDLLVMVLAVILMTLVVKLRTEISAGFVGLALLNVMSFNESLAQIIQNWTKLETSIGAIARLMNFSNQTAPENLPGEDEDVSENWPAYGNIEFKNVSASYTANDNRVIRNLDMSIKAGEKIGICGRSGSGKSSLITTLFRMLEVTEDSSITIDGIDITRLPRELVRSRLNAIPQEPFFVRGTVRNNADPYGDHTDANIVSAIQKVHLWAIVSNKGGLDTELDAEFFSHGQRQLFCLARAILGKSKVVILDEATSSVDTKSDELMQQVIRKEFRDCTIIAVAHRLDTIMDFDRIALLSKGELKEFDSPQALMERQSAFRELYNS
ncbi:related to multidrug resistance protein [Phialocephala subalpina]|uniref:Related to multidrug resistance protein n=1 Tax=Phialocephala subalpina TaxID=576137 RepID=A0A1L7XAS8_9HELO|nr:related to multidrug resistance protein [Phialocephala subalpina]